MKKLTNDNDLNKIHSKINVLNAKIEYIRGNGTST